MSYTTFEYGDLQAHAENGSVRGSVTVRNTGRRDGKETVQVYVRPLSPSVFRPAHELKAFRKVEIAAGEQELNAGKAKLDSGKAELNSGKAKLNAAKGELAAGRETLDENREALSADLKSLDAYTDDSERLRAGMERLMQEEGISARAGKDATNAAVISAARQEVRAEQEAADSEAQRKTVQCALLLLAGLLSLIAVVLILMRSSAGFPLLVAAFPSALAAALISSPLKAPLLFAAALAVIIALAFGTLTYRKKNA